jgi:hypothetical protein
MRSFWVNYFVHDRPKLSIIFCSPPPHDVFSLFLTGTSIEGRFLSSKSMSFSLFFLHQLPFDSEMDYTLNRTLWRK